MRATEAVDRVAAVFDLLADSSEGLTVTEVAHALEVHKATASRLLATLGRHGLVERTRDRRYRIGIGIVLAMAAILALTFMRANRRERMLGA